MKISAVIPLFNAENYIKDAIMSLLNQTIKVDEIVIVDDCGSDSSVEIVKELINYNKNIILIKQPKNIGVSAARNRGIQEAKGDWILFLDADDLCDKYLVEEYIKRVNEDNIAAMYSDFLQVNEFGKAISGSLQGHGLNGNDGFCQMILRNPIISPSGSLVRKSILAKLNGFDTKFHYAEDVDLWLRILLNNNKIEHVSKPLTLIRRHESNTTANLENVKQGEKPLLEKYGLEFIKEKLYRRNLPITENHIDYVNFLIRFEKLNEAQKLLRELDIENSCNRFISFLFLKAIVEIELSSFDQAKKIYSELLKNDESHGASINNLAVIYAMEGRKEKAQEYLQKVIINYPGYMDATHNLRQLALTKPSYRFTKRELRKSLLRYT